MTPVALSFFYVNGDKHNILKYHHHSKMTLSRDDSSGIAGFYTDRFVDESDAVSFRYRAYRCCAATEPTSQETALKGRFKSDAFRNR